jgi:hypothetical protein
MKGKATYLGWLKDVIAQENEKDQAAGDRTPQPPGAPQRIRKPRRALVKATPDTPYFGASPRSGITIRTPAPRADSHRRSDPQNGRAAAQPAPAPRRPQTLRRDFPSLRLSIKPEIIFSANGRPLGAPVQGITHQFDGAGMRLLITIPNPSWVQHLLSGRIQLAITLPLPDNTPAVTLQGRVAWIESLESKNTPSALGILFEAPTPDTQRRLFRFMLTSRATTSNP